jgi:DNA-binding NarL/FixJ family response regulator
VKEARPGVPVRLFWLGGDRRVAEGLLAGTTMEWVRDEGQADLVLGERLPRPEAPSLTPREAEILGYLADGWSNAEIADRLGLRERTIKFHIGSLYAKLGVTRRTEAIREGFNRGLVRF